MAIQAAPTVMVVGTGFIGSAHLRNLKALEKEGLVHVIAGVDKNPERLKIKELEGIPVFTDLKKALSEKKPQIVFVCTNTPEHTPVIQEIFKNHKPEAVFVEKPLAASLDEALAIRAQFHNVHFACGYHFRHSPALARTISYIKEHRLKIKEISATWQKNRIEKGPDRPTQGVIKDEGHVCDALVNGLLPGLDRSNDKITIDWVKRKRQSEVGCLIAPIEKQKEMYGNDPSMMDPFAEVHFHLTVDGIPITIFTSFAKGPQEREIKITCEDGDNTTLFVRFDDKERDVFQVEGCPEEEFPKPNNILREERAFLDFYRTKESDPKISTLDQALVDMKILEVLEEGTKFPQVVDSILY